MRMLPPLSHILTATAAVTLLTGISAMSSVRSAGTITPRQSIFSHTNLDSMRHRFAVPGVTTTFISDTNGDVYLFNKFGIMTATLGGFGYPYGLAVDTSDYLYVADYLEGDISILAPPYTGTRTVLTDSNRLPFGVAVDTNGNVAATNEDGSVSIYAKGAKSPTNILSNPALTYGDYDAFDAQGNLYVDGGSGNKRFVGIIVGGAKGKTIRQLTVGNAPSFTGGIQVTKQGDIAILEGSTIDTYNPPNLQTGSLGEPIAYTSLGGTVTPLNFAFTASNAFAVVVDQGYCFEECYAEAAYLYAYPAGGNPLESVTFTASPAQENPAAVAVSPPEIP